MVQLILENAGYLRVHSLPEICPRWQSHSFVEHVLLQHLMEERAQIHKIHKITYQAK